MNPDSAGLGNFQRRLKLKNAFKSFYVKLDRKLKALSQ